MLFNRDNIKSLFIIIFFVIFTCISCTQKSTKDQLNVQKDTKDSLDIETEFIEADLKVVDFNDSFTLFEIIQNKKQIYIPNHLHIRLNSNYAINSHKVLAPLTSISPSEREVIPNNLIKKYKISHYKNESEKLQGRVKNNSSAVDDEQYTIDQFYSNNKMFSKEVIDKIITMSKNDWIYYAKYLEAEHGVKTENIYEGSDITILVSDNNSIPLYAVGSLFGGTDGKNNGFVVTIFYPEYSLAKSQKDFFEKSLHSKNYKIPNLDYTVFSTCTKKDNAYILDFLVSHM